MSFTIFSFVTSCVFSTLILLAVHLMRNNPSFVKRFGVNTLLLGYTLCLFRMLFTPEFMFTRKLELPQQVNGFYNVVYFQPVQAVFQETSWFQIFLCLWWVVAVLLLLCFSVQYIVGVKRIKRYMSNVYPKAQEVLEKVQEEYDRKIKVKVFICPETSTPLGIGLTSKYILLPNGNYSSQDLYHIVKHEYTHFYNRDLTVKFLVMLFCCVFWWNPAVYLLWRDMAQMLEMKCDLTVTQDYNNNEKKAYLSVIIALLKEQENNSHMAPPTAMGLLKRRRSRILVERFDTVLAAPKKSKRWELWLTFGLCIALFVLSYAVVIQPKYDPPVSEAMSDDGTVDPTLEGYVLKDSNGDYFLYRPGKRPELMKSETVKLFISMGIEVRETDENVGETK